MNIRVKDKVEYISVITNQKEIGIVNYIDMKTKSFTVQGENTYYWTRTNITPIKNITKVIKKYRTKSYKKKKKYILIDIYGRIEGFTKKL